MKLLLIIFCLFATTSHAQQVHQRPVTCYDVSPFIATMKEMKMQTRFSYDTQYGVMAHADNGVNFIVFEYVKSINKFCVYAEVERV